VIGSGAATPTYAAPTPNQFEGALIKNRSLGQDILPSPGQPKRTESLYMARGQSGGGGGGGVSGGGSGGGGGGGGGCGGGGGGGAGGGGGIVPKVSAYFLICICSFYPSCIYIYMCICIYKQTLAMCIYTYTHTFVLYIGRTS